MNTHIMVTKESWLPIAEYAMRTGISISTLRRKIKADAISYRMEEGRYLLRSNPADFAEDAAVDFPYVSVDTAPKVVAPPQQQQLSAGAGVDELRWRALDARVAGLAKKVDMLAEQLSEMKMLIKVFEEKIDGYR
jgi:hypothetical protein